jgi:hypothetical protein
MTTRTTELRRWWRKGDHFYGHVYNDPLDHFSDGEFVELPIEVLADNGSFYILVSNSAHMFKLNKDDGREN